MKNRPHIGILSETMFLQINQNRFLGILSQKWVKNILKRPVKARFGLVWFGNVLVVISGIARYKEFAKMDEKRLKKYLSKCCKLGFFICLVFDILTIFLCLAMLGMIQDHNQGSTKPNQSKSSLYRPFLGVFDPFFGQNTPKPIVIDLKEHSS